MKNFRDNLHGLAREIFFEVMAEAVSELCGLWHYPVSGSRYRVQVALAGAFTGTANGSKSRPRVRRTTGGINDEANLRSFQAEKNPEAFALEQSGNAGQTVQTLTACRRRHPAIKILKNIEKFLKTRSKVTYESLYEGWDELTAFQRLEVPSTLNAGFLSANFIKNSFNNVRHKIGRVKRWRSGTRQPKKRLAFAPGDAEKGFRRIRNSGEMKALMAAPKRTSVD